MIQKISKKLMNKYLILALGGLFIIGSAGCKKDDDDDGTADDDKTAVVANPDFIKNGSKVEFTAPTIGTYSTNVQGEDNYTWTGNAPGNGYTLTINQAIARKEGSVVASGWSGSMLWGSTNMSLSGSYTLSKDANGKWVSTFSGNGTESVGTGGATTDYPGIEFKITWPE